MQIVDTNAALGIMVNWVTIEQNVSYDRLSCDGSSRVKRKA